MATNSVDINKAFASGGLTTNYTPPKPTSVGVKTKTPVVKPPINTTPQPVKTPTVKAPDDSSNMYNTATGQLNTKYVGYKPPAQEQAPNNTTSQAPQYTANNGLYGQLVTGLANQSNPQNQATTGIVKDLQGGDYQKRLQDAKAAQERAVNINQGLNQAIQNQTKEAIPIQFQQGRQGAIQRDYGVQAQAATSAAQNAAQIAGLTQSGLSSAGGLANSQQGLIQQALQSAGSMSAPQFPSYGSAQLNPVTNTYGTVGGGAYGSGPSAAANVQSIGDAQKQINDINQNSQAIDNQFSAIANYANQAGLTGNSPIVEGFKNRFGVNFATNPAVVGFNQSVNSLNQILQTLGESPIDINTATKTTIEQAQQTVKANLARKQANYQDFISNFNSGGGTSSGSTGGNMFGSFFGG